MEDCDFLIIGAGAAGLTAAFYGARAGLKVFVLDDSGTGGQVMEIPQLENYPGIFPAVNGNELIQKMQEQAESFGVKIIYEKVTSINKKDDKFLVETDGNTFESYALLVATGAEHKKLKVPGEKELYGRGVSYCAVCDGPFFKNKKVTVIGGGDSACSEALFLSGIAKEVNLIHRRDSFKAQKAIVDSLKKGENINIMLNSSVEEIKSSESNKVSSIVIKDLSTEKITEIKTDAVFIFVGMNPRTDLTKFIPKDEGGYIKTDENMQTSFPGLFCAGDVRSKPLRQIVTAASDGAIAAYSAEKYINSLKAK